MRKIEREMINAINNFKPYHNDNTDVEVFTGKGWEIRLHGHLIARMEGTKLYLSDCGYQTKTTKSRLNCLLNHFDLPTLSAKKFKWYLGKEEWTGNKTFETKKFSEEEKECLIDDVISEW